MASSSGGETSAKFHVPDSAKGDDKENFVKIICLGDSAVGKSKLVERFLMDGYQPQQLSTYALTLFQYRTKVNDKDVRVDIWDTAGQERFNNMHPSYYHQSHACILAFDITRKATYKNLTKWYKELREYRADIPCILVANKIDIDFKVTEKSFNFPKKYGLPFYFVSAADGTNVVKLFREAIKLAYRYKENSTDFIDVVMKELEAMDDLDLEDDKFATTVNGSKETGNDS
ncbi:rab-like protein 2A [Xenia sp. Carnegie-2017]|uniref:rab-like protein 2A n=1 Tax=Xenia sp. Carnegie-2017 TaxID=2897299 RepID=UPI001F04BDD6|nr:rab-like protein 2A [Xenia sp. Carnegie-2017]